MRKIVVFVVTSMVCQGLFAQEGGRKVVEDLVKHWQRAKTLSLAVAEKMPENAYAFKVAETSFSEPLGGSALLNVLSCSMASGTAAPAGFQTAFDRHRDDSKPAVMKDLGSAYDYCIEGLKNLNDAELFKLVAYKGQRVTKLDVYWDALGHSTHALGQAAVYLRLKGIAPPETGPSYDF